MTSGGKILLGLLALGGITLAVFHSGEAHADTLPPNPEPPNPLPNPLPSLPSLPGTSTPVIPPAGTPIVVPGGGVVPVPSIPGVNTAPLPTPPVVVPLPPSASPFPAGPSIPLPGGGSIPNPLGGLTPVPPPNLPPLVVTPGPAPAPSAPPASPAELPGSAPADTLAAVTSLLQQEANPHWRVVPNAALVAWQKARGLTADGNLGTGTALALAKEIGTIPIIRGWPKGSFPGDGKLDNYRASLQQIANSAPEPRASQLRASAARETGQGYGTPEQPILHLITIQS